MSDYTYNQYLEQWDDHFGNEERGKFIYWQLGQKLYKSLPKMNEKTFTQTLAKFDELSPQIDILQGRDDYGSNETLDNRVDNLLKESFECELPLFF